MRRLLALGFVLAACHSGPPAPPPPPTDTTVYEELVLAECMAATDGGVAAVAALHAKPNHPAWLDCLYDGGTPASCALKDAGACR